MVSLQKSLFCKIYLNTSYEIRGQNISASGKFQPNTYCVTREWQHRYRPLSENNPFRKIVIFQTLLLCEINFVWIVKEKVTEIT